MADKLDMDRIPQHIAIIMDGNGRWAAEQGKPRSYGHQAGVDTVRRITSECTRLGVKFLTLYTSPQKIGIVPKTRYRLLWGWCSHHSKTRFS
jgi:undecaprenyl diphosphate synthase